MKICMATAMSLAGASGLAVESALLIESRERMLHPFHGAKLFSGGDNRIWFLYNEARPGDPLYLERMRIASEPFVPNPAGSGDPPDRN